MALRYHSPNLFVLYLHSFSVLLTYCLYLLIFLIHCLYLLLSSIHISIFLYFFLSEPDLLSCYHSSYDVHHLARGEMSVGEWEYVSQQLSARWRIYRTLDQAVHLSAHKM